eukprot:91261-Amphidinium_carterae.1
MGRISKKGKDQRNSSNANCGHGIVHQPTRAFDYNLVLVFPCDGYNNGVVAGFVVHQQRNVCPVLSCCVAVECGLLCALRPTWITVQYVCFWHLNQHHSGHELMAIGYVPTQVLDNRCFRVHIIGYIEGWITGSQHGDCSLFKLASRCCLNQLDT